MSLLKTLDLPSPDVTNALIALAKAGDSAAVDTLFNNYQILVEITVNAMVKSEYMQDARPDLIQQGSLGLLSSIKRYNPSTGNAFTTYAISMIQGYVKTGIASEIRWRQRHRQIGFFETSSYPSFGVEDIVIDFIAESSHEDSISEEAERLDLGTVLGGRERRFVRTKYGL